MAFGSFESGSSQPMADINTTPLVDVMLVLLVIFIVTAPLVTQAIKVDLPEAAAAPVESKAESIRLSLDAQGQHFWNEQPLTADEFQAKLEEAAKQQPQPDVLLAADKETRYEDLTGLMSKLQQQGLTKVSFITLAPAAGGSSASPATNPEAPGRPGHRGEGRGGEGRGEGGPRHGGPHRGGPGPD